MLTIHFRHRSLFSIINKIRNRQKIKNPPLQRVVTKPYQVGDIIGQQTFQARKDYLTPYQIYLIETKSLQRPYTGNLWGEKSTGFYHCAVCNTRLFSFDQKIKDQTGFASFWDCVQKRVSVIDQKVNLDMVNLFDDAFLQKNKKQHKRCQCSQCKSHIGAVFFDGPYPTFLRFSVNSSALTFQELEDFPDPNIARKQKQKLRQSAKIRYLR